MSDLNTGILGRTGLFERSSTDRSMQQKWDSHNQEDYMPRTPFDKQLQQKWDPRKERYSHSKNVTFSKKHRSLASDDPFNYWSYYTTHGLS